MLDYITENIQGYFKLQNGLIRALFLLTSLSPGFPFGTAFILRLVFLQVERWLFALKQAVSISAHHSRVRKNFSPNQQRSGLHSYWTNLGHVPSLDQSLWIEIGITLIGLGYLGSTPGAGGEVDNPIQTAQLLRNGGELVAGKQLNSVLTYFVPYTALGFDSVTVNNPVQPNTHKQTFKTFIAQL